MKHGTEVACQAQVFPHSVPFLLQHAHWNLPLMLSRQTHRQSVHPRMSTTVFHMKTVKHTKRVFSGEVPSMAFYHPPAKKEEEVLSDP